MEAVWPGAPRYGPRLPLPSRAFVPGAGTRPAETPPLPPEQAFLRGIDLYHAGFLWEAHEQWEGVWRSSKDAVERDFLQALIQLAAAALKLRLGNARGARKLALRARARLARIPAARYKGVEIAPIDAFLARVPDAPPPRLPLA